MKTSRAMAATFCLVALWPPIELVSARSTTGPEKPPPAIQPAPSTATSAEDAGWMLPAAEASIDGRARVLNTLHYRFYMSEAAGRDASDLVSNFEALWDFYEKTLASLVPLGEPNGKINVFMFATRNELERFAAAAPGTPAGHRPGLFWQRAPAFVAFDVSAVLGPSDLGVLFHAVVRVAHQVLLYDQGLAGSWWVREGIAVYFMQTLFDREGRFHAGEIRTSAGYVSDTASGGRLSAGTVAAREPRKALKAARKSYLKNRHLPIRELLDLDADHVWPDAASRQTASVEAWILVHFLLHAREGELRPRPATFLVHERQGQGGAEMFRRTVSRDLDRFEVFLFDHVHRME